MLFYFIPFNFLSFIVSVTWLECVVPARDTYNDTTTTLTRRGAWRSPTEAVVATGTFLKATVFAILSARYVLIKKLLIF